MEQSIIRRQYWPGQKTPPIPFVPAESEDILIIDILTPHAREIGKVVKALSVNQPLPRRILINSYAEPADFDFLDSLNSIVAELGIEDKFAVYDAGRHLYQYKNIRTVIHSPWWINATVKKFKDTAPIPFTQRTTKFSCLNRIARRSRIYLVQHIIDAGILPEGLVTCGSASWTYNFQDACRPDLVHFFPMDPLKDLGNLDNSFDATMPNQKLMNCLINLITESSYERLTDFKENWERGMTTEKTFKTYMSHQLPIWSAPLAFVNYQKEMGFDIFDDLIDHSYDNIVNPWARLEAVVKELKKLVSMPINELQDFCIKNEHRFVHNRNWTIKLAQEHTAEAFEDFKKWLD